MKIYLVPQVPKNDDDRIIYSFEGDKITAKINGIEETFDFEGVPNGQLSLYDKNDNLKIATQLDPFPIRSVVKKEGTLYVQLLNWIPVAVDKEVIFPTWIDASEYKIPVEIKEEEHVPLFQKDFNENSIEFISKIQKERYKITNEDKYMSKKPQ